MNRAMRMLTLVGLGLMTGATIGATPALAADGAGQAATKPSTVKVQPHGGDDEEIVGYFRTRRACERAGWIGERFNRWEDHDCERVRWGFRRGMWALEVERDFDWHRPGHGHGPWDNGNGHGPWNDGDGHGPWNNGHRANR
jgi:hypothetical protein